MCLLVLLRGRVDPPPPVCCAIRQWDGRSVVAWKPFWHDNTIRLCSPDCLCPLIIGIGKQQEAAKGQGQAITHQFLHRQGETWQATTQTQWSMCMEWRTQVLPQKDIRGLRLPNTIQFTDGLLKSTIYSLQFRNTLHWLQKPALRWLAPQS